MLALIDCIILPAHVSMSLEKGSSDDADGRLFMAYITKNVGYMSTQPERRQGMSAKKGFVATAIAALLAILTGAGS